MDASKNITRMINLRRMRWIEHVARMGGNQMDIAFWHENLKENNWKTYA